MSVTKVTDAMRNVTQVDAAKITTGTIPEARITTLDATKLTGDIALARLDNAPATDTSVLEYNVAMLAFKVASANQLAKFSMVDQVIDEYQDATGIDAGASTNERAAGATTAKYYDGGTTVTPSVTGGATTVVGDYTYHVFTSGTVNYVTDTTQDLDFLVVAGGGSGGFGESGGGGAGGLIYRTEKSVANGTYSVTVGAGGGTGDPGNSGADSTFGSLFTAKGGGYGGYYSGPVAAASGGSGGGADHNGDTTFGTSTQAGQSGDSGTYGFGFAGGRGDTGSSHGNAQGSGGGGGARG